jgi:pseudouridine synthase
MVRERLQKVLSSAGVASRRRAEELIAAGAVTVNGRVARVGDSADRERDDIRVTGRPVAAVVAPTHIALNKPTGYVSSLRSTHGEPTVIALVPHWPRLFPVGRLDKDTSGLLLLTDDGDWANLVTHPRYGVEKEYRAVVRGRPVRSELHRLRTGVTLPDGTVTAPARVEQIGDDRGNAVLSITVIEGKKRQIRLMSNAVGHPVLSLQRVRVGGIELGTLRQGEWRNLTSREVNDVRDIARRNAGAERKGTRDTD